jgi:hypothetical protein
MTLLRSTAGNPNGNMPLSQVERRLGFAERLAAVIPDERDASRVTHRLPDIPRARIFAIAGDGLVTATLPMH